MRFQLLGPLDLRDDEASIEVRRPKQRALLASLLLNANQVVSTHTLIESLWEGDAPETAAKALQVHVSRLRKLLGPSRLQTRAPGYRLVVEEGEYDVSEFELLVRAAHDEGSGRASSMLRDALALWRGEPLAEFSGYRFAQAEIARLTELRLVTLEEAIEHELASGPSAGLLSELEGLISKHPLRERFRHQLMRALYRAGRQADALAVYRSGRSALRNELGLEPGRALRELERAILRQESALEAVPADPPSELGSTTPAAFVGRQAELGELLAGLEDALVGRGRLILLTGEPGMGKSRLADELIRAALARGARVLVGRCWEAGGAPAYWPWVQSLRGYIRETESGLLRAQLGSRAGEVAQLVPELRDVLSGSPEEPRSRDAEGARLRLFDATTEFLRVAAEHQAIVLFLDDLHAADAPSLLLLQYLARELRASRLLVLAAYRSIDPRPGQPLRTLLAEVTREPATRRLVLTGLSKQNVAEYVHLTVSDDATPELASALYEETEGNPLFMVEMLRLLATEDAPSTPRANAAEIVVPESVQDVISRRFMRLSDESNRVLMLAAVLGREFALDALGRLADVSQDELLDTLDEAMSEGILSVVPGASGSLRFAHVLMRDTLYDGLTTARLVRLHRMAAAALEELYGADPGAHLSELAHHAIAGSEFDKALGFARRAGDRALTGLAFEEAARLYQVALEAAEVSGASSTVRCELLLAQGDAQTLAGEGPVARTLLLQAADLAREEEDAELLARAVLAYAGRDIWGPRLEWDPQFLPLLEEAIARVGEEDSIVRARLLARAASTLRGAVDRGRPEALAREAVAIATRLGDEATLLFALDGQLAVADGPGTAAERVREGAELARLGSDAGDHERAFDGHEHTLYAAWTLGDRATMEATIDAMTRLVENVDLQMFRSLVPAFRAVLATAQGRLGDAEEFIECAFRLGERAQTWNTATTHRLQTFMLRSHRGDLDGYDDVLRQSVDDYPGYRIFDCALAWAYAQLDRRPECLAIFEDTAKGRFGHLSRDGDWLVNLCLLSEASSYVGDLERAGQLADLLTPFAGLHAVAAGEIAMGAVAHHLGRLTAELGRFDDAEAHFEAALEMNAHMGARTWVAHTQTDYACMLLARGDTGDRGRAGDLLARAVSEYEALGMRDAGRRARMLTASPC